MNTKISIVTVCYNAEQEIQKTIHSVLSQNYDNIEYIIIDGCSTDNTLNVVNKTLKSFPFRDVQVYSEKDKGIFDAMNKGIANANGLWLNFMNAGDVFCNDEVLSHLFNKSYPDSVGVVYGDTYNNDGLFHMVPFTKYPNGYREMGICHQSLFVRTALAKEKLFDLSFKVAADYNMVRNIYDNGYELRYVNTPVSVYDMNGFSTKNVMRQVDEVAIICHKYHSFSHFRVKIINYLKLLIKSILNK